MSSRRLASARTAALNPLGTAGQRSFEVIRREAAKLGPAHEALFAEPFPSPEGDLIDWYGAGSGSAAPVSALDEAARAAAMARLDGLVADILARAQTLEQDRDPERRRLGEALRNAVEIPDEGAIYVIGEQPVLTNWAHRSNVAQARRGVLSARIAAPTPPAPPTPPASQPDPAPASPVAPVVAAPAAPRRFDWLWYLLWGVVGALAAAIAVVLLPACGVLGPRWLDHCPAPVAETPPEISRTPGLRAELDALQRALLDRDTACRGPALICETPPTETALLLDASTSMRFGVRTPAEVERELADIAGRAAADGAFASPADAARYSDLVRGARAPAMGRPRIEALREALGAAVDMTDPLRVRIAPFARCGQLRLGDVVEDGAAARAFVDGMELESFTALAYAIGRATASLEGGRTADDPANIVLVTDGFDTCGGDPCAAARAAKQARPGLRIDVVDLTGLEEMRCIADATGGRYVDASRELEPALLARLLSDAAARGRDQVCLPEPFEARDAAPADRAEVAPAIAPPDAFDTRVEQAGGETEAPLRITLLWDTISDLDLSITCPGGGRIYYDAPNACGGVLDTDRNAREPSAEPVENVVFPASPAPGEYIAVVNNFAQRGAQPNPFRLRIERASGIEIHEGALTATGESRSFAFTYP